MGIRGNEIPRKQGGALSFKEATAQQENVEAKATLPPPAANG